MSAVVDKIESILTNEYSVASYVELMSEIFDNLQLLSINNARKEFSNFSSYIENYTHIGTYTSPDSKKILILAVELKKQSYVENSRSTQRSYAKRLIENGNADAAIIAFYTAGETHWRLSFVRLDYEMKFENGKLKTAENMTPARRYSFLVGKYEPCHTAIDRFRLFLENYKMNPTLDDLESAFSVEAVTKEFFNLYCEKFHQLREHLEKNPDFVQEAQLHNFTSAQFSKKLMGQIVFLYFLQKKGWLGVKAWPSRLSAADYKKAFWARGAKSRELIPQVYVQVSETEYAISAQALNALSNEDETFLSTCVKGEPWGSGPRNFMRRLFETSQKRNANFFDEYLEPLFYDALNVNRGEQGYDPALHCRIPFLSGGLFEPIDGYDWEHNNFAIPNEIFSNKKEDNDRLADGILDIFDRYNFTMSEDEPMEREVAIDPEMLGKVFENLLDVTDRKSKGAFYTPREIVHYMCQESLINYLTGTLKVSEAAVRDFILYGDFMKDEDGSVLKRAERDGRYDLFISEELYLLDSTGKPVVDRLVDMDKALQDVRVADPAVGSGAFPLGMLNEIVRARQNITTYMDITSKALDPKGAPNQIRLRRMNDRSAHMLKYETIRNCIYAVDIEPSAVDIAQLRLWLALVIDDEINPNAASILDGHRNPLPLPNLECNILCGNSLIDEFEDIKLINESELIGTATGGQIDMYQSGFDAILEQLIKKQEELFRCDNTDKKQMLLAEIADLRDALIENQIAGINPDKRERYEATKGMASKPFILWQLDFARVFKAKGGFDVVIGNPPYVLIQDMDVPDTIKDYYKSHFEVAAYKVDLFHLFFERGIALLKDHGVLSYITPNTYLTNMYIKPLRKYILERCNIHQIINHDKVFDAASVDSATIVMSREMTPTHESVIQVMQSAHFSFTEVCTKKQSDWSKDKELIFNINPEEIATITNCLQLGDICKTYFGIQAFDRKSSISSIKESDQYLPFIDGADIHPYSYSEPKIYFYYIPENIKSGGDWQVYARDRVVIRQIGQIPVVGLCKGGILGSNTLYSVYTKDERYSLLFILACLNSSFIKTYWKAKYSDNKATFPKIKGFQLKELPIPDVSVDQQANVVSLVEQLLQKKQSNEPDTVVLEAEIDSLISQMYGS